MTKYEAQKDEANKEWVNQNRTIHYRRGTQYAKTEAKIRQYKKDQANKTRLNKDKPIQTSQNISEKRGK